jgi:hypothetical protein
MLLQSRESYIDFLIATILRLKNALQWAYAKITLAGQ